MIKKILLRINKYRTTSVSPHMYYFIPLNIYIAKMTLTPIIALRFWMPRLRDLVFLTIWNGCEVPPSCGVIIIYIYILVCMCVRVYFNL